MDFEKDRGNGKIFPELRDEGRGFTWDSEEPAADWREQPLEPIRDAKASHDPRRAAARDSRRGSTGPLWLVLAFLLVLLAGVSFYGYQKLLDAHIRLSQVPALLNSMTAFDGRMNNVETQMRAWTENFQGLPSRVGKLEKRVKVDYGSARRHAEALTAQLRKQIQDQMRARERVVDARLDQLTSDQKSAAEREARLQQQLSDAQQEIAALRQETNGDLALLDQHVAGNEQQVNNLTQQVERGRVNFELSKNQIAELSPEITMDLTSTDVTYQRYSGWVYFQPDHRYLWVRDQGVAQPVVFYDQQQARQYQVVVTGLHGGSATGYLLLPATGAVLSSQVAEDEPAGQ
jgi:predicted  nucleic acid-binding Zn-ribbon protein